MAVYLTIRSTRSNTQLLAAIIAGVVVVGCAGTQADSPQAQETASEVEPETETEAETEPNFETEFQCESETELSDPVALRLQASKATSAGIVMPRSCASDETTLLLEDGGTATWAVDVPESGEYEFVVRYSNDNHGELETVAVSVDGDIVGEFEALDTGDDGEGWNVFYESPPLGPYRIEAGEREFGLSVGGGDGYGVEIDNVSVD
jgi:hypothetical protein